MITERETPNITATRGELKVYELEHMPLIGSRGNAYILNDGVGATWTIPYGETWQIASDGWKVQYDGNKTFTFDLRNSSVDKTFEFLAIKYNRSKYDMVHAFADDKSKVEIKQELVQAEMIEISPSVPINVDAGISLIGLPFPEEYSRKINTLINIDAFFGTARYGYYENPNRAIFMIGCNIARGDYNYIQALVYSPSGGRIETDETIWYRVTYI